MCIIDVLFGLNFFNFNKKKDNLWLGSSICAPFYLYNNIKNICIIFLPPSGLLG